MLATLFDALGIGLLAAGLALATVGLYGTLRMPDVFRQLHAAGLVTGPAVVLMLLAALTTGDGETVTSALLMILFVSVTAPLAAHAIAQAEHRRPPGESEPDP